MPRHWCTPVYVEIPDVRLKLLNTGMKMGVLTAVVVVIALTGSHEERIDAPELVPSFWFAEGGYAEAQALTNHSYCQPGAGPDACASFPLATVARPISGAEASVATRISTSEEENVLCSTCHGQPSLPSAAKGAVILLFHSHGDIFSHRV